MRKGVMVTTLCTRKNTLKYNIKKNRQLSGQDFTVFFNNGAKIVAKLITKN